MMIDMKTLPEFDKLIDEGKDRNLGSQDNGEI
jgi:hypothetical protein